MKAFAPPSICRLVLLLLLLGACAGCSIRVARPAAPSRDFHTGIWLTRNVMEEGEEAIAAFLDDAADRGITAVYPDFWFHGYAIYPGSRQVEQHPDFAGWNPLEVILREAEKQGLEVYPWAEYGFFTHFNRTDSQEDVGHILERQPEWIAEDREGRVSVRNPDRKTSHYSLNPAHPDARRFLRELMLEAVRLHPGVAGLNLDRIRYPGSDFSYDPYSREAFKAEHGFDPLLIGLDPEQRALWDRWRIDQINTFMRELAEAFRAEFPRKVLSASVVPPYMMEEKFQRWEEAVSRGHLDVPIPMIYGSLDLVQREIDRSFDLLPRRSKLYVGLDAGSMSSVDFMAAVDYARSKGAAGIVLWDDDAFRRKSDLRFAVQ